MVVLMALALASRYSDPSLPMILTQSREAGVGTATSPARVTAPTVRREWQSNGLSSFSHGIWSQTTWTLILDLGQAAHLSSTVSSPIKCG